MHLLCRECERRFDEGGEKWTLANYYRGDSFRLKETLLSSQPIVPFDGGALYTGAGNARIDMDRLCYFAASVFWRGACQKWTILGEDVHIQLGPYEEPLRKFLLDAAPFPERMALVIRVYSETAFNATASPPRFEFNGNGFHQYGFNVPGIEFRLAVGSKIPPEYYELCPIRCPDRPLWMDSRSDATMNQEIAQRYRRATTTGR
jgi:hypothetical protein